MSDILYAPDREHVITTNAWAFLHWLRTTRGIDLPDWAALQRWSASDQAAFSQAIAAFGRLPLVPLRLARHGGQQEALVLRRADGSRLAFSRDLLRHPQLNTRPAGGGWGRGHTRHCLQTWPRRWPGSGLLPLLIRPLAELLLHADLRPDDRLLVVGAAWPWLAALLEGTTVILAAASPGARCWPPPPRNVPPSSSPRRRPSPRRRFSAPAAARTSPTCGRSSPPAARSRLKAAAASTPGSSPT